jgi:hypothetical protein
MKKIRSFINGAYVEPAEWVDDFDPSTGKVFAQYGPASK